MKSKKAGLAVILTMVSLMALGQAPGYGLKGGINLSSFGADAVGSDTRIGLNVGGYMNMALGDGFAYQPEASISLEGDDDVSFTNLNLGVLGKYNLNELSFEFGPQLGLILGDDDSSAEAVNVTLGIGAGYKISEGIVGGIRYNAGLSDVFELVNADITNNTFSLNVFVAL
ncbi:MAG: porin family protein [Ekhidna sp.]